jgi:hypothetical protein
LDKGHFLRVVSSAMNGAVDGVIYQPFKTAKTENRGLSPMPA